MKIFVVQSCDGRQQWVERLYANEHEAMQFAKERAQEHFECRSINDTDLKLFGPDAALRFAEWSYGYSPESAESLIIVTAYEVHGSPLIALAEQAE